MLYVSLPNLQPMILKKQIPLETRPWRDFLSGGHLTIFCWTHPAVLLRSNTVQTPKEFVGLFLGFDLGITNWGAIFMQFLGIPKFSLAPFLGIPFRFTNAHVNLSAWHRWSSNLYWGAGLQGLLSNTLQYGVLALWHSPSVVYSTSVPNPPHRIIQYAIASPSHQMTMRAHRMTSHDVTRHHITSHDNSQRTTSPHLRSPHN